MLDDLISMIDTYEARGVRVYVISLIPRPGFNHAQELRHKHKCGLHKCGLIGSDDNAGLSKVPYAEFYY